MRDDFRFLMLSAATPNEASVEILSGKTKANTALCYAQNDNSNPFHYLSLWIVTFI